jgi:hypothetical protein
VGWFSPEEVAGLRMHHTQLLRVEYVATFEPMIGTLRSSHHVLVGREAELVADPTEFDEGVQERAPLAEVAV